MQDDVKFIFKSLIKVPVIIFEVYFVFNIFCLMFIFFKTLGYSYVVMQTVVENNYVPKSEVDSLDAQLGDLREIKFVGGNRYDYSLAHIVIDDEAVYPNHYDGNGKNTRTQYGSVKQCGVYVNYKIQWPLRPDQQSSNGQAVNGLQGGGGSYTNFGPVESGVPITITYKVPGLQYYPDLNVN